MRKLTIGISSCSATTAGDLSQNAGISLATVKSMELLDRNDISVHLMNVHSLSNASVDFQDWIMPNDMSGGATATERHMYYLLTDNYEVRVKKAIVGVANL